MNAPFYRLRMRHAIGLLLSGLAVGIFLALPFHSPLLGVIYTALLAFSESAQFLFAILMNRPPELKVVGIAARGSILLVALECGHIEPQDGGMQIVPQFLVCAHCEALRTAEK